MYRIKPLNNMQRSKEVLFKKESKKKKYASTQIFPQENTVKHKLKRELKGSEFNRSKSKFVQSTNKHIKIGGLRNSSLNFQT